MSLRDVPLKTEYRSLLNNVIETFYTPILSESVLYKRAVGFFSSSALIELSAGILGLVKNGGKIQLIASPRLSQEDIAAINDGFRRRDEVIEEALLRELDSPNGIFEEARLNLLSNLIACGRLEIKIAFLENDNVIGMFHEKVGLMYDDEDMGDFKKDKQVTAADALERESRGKQNRSVRGFVNEGRKEKVISAKVYPDMWDKFSRINMAQGMTNSSVINQLIAKYVRDNEGWLKE